MWTVRFPQRVVEARYGYCVSRMKAGNCSTQHEVQTTTNISDRPEISENAILILVRTAERRSPPAYPSATLKNDESADSCEQQRASSQPGLATSVRQRIRDIFQLNLVKPQNAGRNQHLHYIGSGGGDQGA